MFFVVIAYRWHFYGHWPMIDVDRVELSREDFLKEILHFIKSNGGSTLIKSPDILDLKIFLFEAMNRIKTTFEQTNEHRLSAAAIRWWKHQWTNFHHFMSFILAKQQ